MCFLAHSVYCRSGTWRGGKVLSFVGNWGPFFWSPFVGISFPSVAVCPCLLSADQAYRRYTLLQPKDWIYSMYASILSTYTSPLQFLMTVLAWKRLYAVATFITDFIISTVSGGSARILPSALQFSHCEYENDVLYQSTWYCRNPESNDEKGGVVKIFLEKSLILYLILCHHGGAYALV